LHHFLGVDWAIRALDVLAIEPVQKENQTYHSPISSL